MILSSRVTKPSVQMANPAKPEVNFAAAGNVTGNLKQVNRAFWENALQDPLILKNNALILASLLLVVSRLWAVNKSAVQAKGTSEEHHRKSEAVKTSMREIGGFTLSFVVLRLVQYLTKQFIHRTFDLPKETSLFSSTWSHFKAAITEGVAGRKVRHGFVFLDPDLKIKDDPKNMVDAYKHLNVDRFFRKKALRLQGEKQLAQVLENVKFIHTWVPLVIGSIPAVWLSGFWLERFTQDHATSIAENISSHLGKDAKTNHPAEASKQSPSSATSSLPMDNAFKKVSFSSQTI